MVKHLGNKYDTNCGMLEVIKYINSRNVLVRFVNTGHVKTARMDDIKNGEVKDPFYPSVLGVGFLGGGEHKVSINGKKTKAYICWKSMLERCYSAKRHKENPTYIGCTVHPDWHNFQTFAAWYYKNHPDDGKKYDLDKDIIVKGNRVYSPETCMFVSHEKNMVEAHAKSYTFRSPNGAVTKVYNLNKFCRDNGLHQVFMSQVHSGKRKSHKGWTK